MIAFVFIIFKGEEIKNKNGKIGSIFNRKENKNRQKHKTLGIQRLFCPKPVGNAVSASGGINKENNSQNFSKLRSKKRKKVNKE